MSTKDVKLLTNGNENGASVLKQQTFEFVVPPEAPVFCPSESEFQDPLSYIDKIRYIAEQSGICKIKPPPNWQPPFAVDVDKLKFTPRIQRLNELEAKTRIKLNFLDQIAKFWELQGSSLKIPMVEKRALDLYTLHRLVHTEGGFNTVSKERKWSKIATFMGYPQGKSIGTILKTHYERLLYPFEIFCKEKTPTKPGAIIKEEPSDSGESKVKHETQTNINTSPQPKKTYVRRKRVDEDVNVIQDIKIEGDDASDENNKELKRLQFYGAGPKMAGYIMDKKDDKIRIKSQELDPLAKYICHNCRRGDAEENMLLCDGCDDSYHTFCLMPPLAEIPKGDWCCPKCVAEEVSKPTEAFGFEQAQREYTLQQFGEMADQFKSEYFNMPVHLVPTGVVEKEFWRIVSSIDEDVTVEYGADLHTMDHGSGFPTKDSMNLFPGDQEYAYSGWNLNNLPVLEGSVLGYINADISGMKVPWMYVGMCFATFCWHNEDHWSYSINYLHWGEPKTWYGVPGCKAEMFEETMKSAAPELFQSQPDLLHQLVTIMNPNILMNAGVPVYRTDQHAGEFVVTFPRAYHAGFNQGYNFAEAVNFAPADWVAMGRECILHYSQLRRFCVFSHDELVCKMATNPDKLDLTVAAATYKDMSRMVDTEKKLRKNLLDMGVTNAEREAFELLPDDERQCEVCKTTCFMSAISCKCSSDILVCLRHYNSLCNCTASNRTLRYRYTLDELLPLLRNLKNKAESFDKWADKVRNALDRNKPKVLTLNELKAMLAEADDKHFPKSDLIITLMNAIEDADKCASVIKQLDLNKIRTRHSNDSKSKLTLEELTLFCEEIDDLACILDEEKIIKDLLEKTNQFEAESTRLLETPLQSCNIVDVERCINNNAGLCIDLPSMQQMNERLQQLKWLKDVQTRHKVDDIDDIDTLKNILQLGLKLKSNDCILKVLRELQNLITEADRWEHSAQLVLKKSSPDALDEMDELIKEALTIKVYLPTEKILLESKEHAHDWFKCLRDLNSLEAYPYLTSMEELIKKSKSFAFQLYDVKRLKNYVIDAHDWKENTSRIFLRKNSSLTLMEALSPRTQITQSKSKRKSVEDELSHMKFNDDLDTAAVVALFKDAEDKEMKAIKALRTVNSSKSLDVNDGDAFCICLKGVSGVMMQCELCRDWFHANCVQLPKLASMKIKGNLRHAMLHMGYRDTKFLCPNCFRTRRPRLKSILDLLVGLQQLHIRLPDGEALQSLTERAMSWQDRTRQLLRTKEIEICLSKVNQIIQKFLEAAAKVKTEKIISAELKKAANNPDLHQRVQQITNLSGIRDKKNESACFSPDHANNLIDDVVSKDNEIKSDEHAYSLNMSKIEDVEYKIDLSPTCYQLLEELIIEGDLMEVYLEELPQLWQILHATKLNDSKPFIVDFDFTQKFSKKGFKKRRSEENEVGKFLKQPKLDTNKKVKTRKVRETKDVKREGGVKGRKLRNRQSQNSDDEDDENCASAECIQPLGEEVHWIQCDGGCELWFHMACVGLSQKDINEEDDYICIACSRSKESLQSSSSVDIDELANDDNAPIMTEVKC